MRFYIQTLNFLVAIFIIFNGTNSFSNNTVLLYSDTIESYSLSNKLLIYEDKKTDQNINDVIRLNNSGKFYKIGNPKINIGFSNSAYWIYFSIKNTSAKTIPVVLSIQYPLLNYIDFYEIINDSIKRVIYTGELTKFSTREIFNPDYSFYLKIESKKEYKYYIRVFNNGETIRIPIILNSYKRFIDIYYYDLFFKGLFYGLMIFIILFNLFLFLTLKEKIYFYCMLYVLFLSVFLANIDGLSFQFLWKNYPDWANISTIIFATLANLFLLIFSKFFLVTKDISPKINKLILIFIFILIVISGLCFIPYPYFLYVVKTINVFSLLVAILVLIASINSLINKFKPARYFLFSFVFLLIGVSLYIARNFGLLPNNSIAKYGVKFGLALEVTLLTFGVSDRYRRLKEEANINLEKLVTERTKEIYNQKEEIKTQRDQIEEKNENLSYAYDIIENKNKSIMDSIIYAQRIQKAIFPPEYFITRSLNDSFVLLIPKDFVSGDFYWLVKKNNLIYFAAVDCTGHGVPGAFMSIIGYDILTHSIKDKNLTKPSDILNNTNNELYQTLKREKEDFNLKEGMDMALCCYNKENKILQYSGACNPLYIIRNNELIKYQGDKRSIGSKFKDDFVSYTNHEIQLQEGDIFYIFSDGYYDQFGGEFGKKYMTKRFKDLLLKIHKMPLKVQKEMLNIEFELWKGSYEQLDDVLIIGVRI